MLSLLASIWIFFPLFRLDLSLYGGIPGGESCLYRRTSCCLAFKCHFSKQFLKKDPPHRPPEYLLIQGLQRGIICSSSHCGGTRRGCMFAEAQDPFWLCFVDIFEHRVPALSHAMGSSFWKPSPVWMWVIAGCLCFANSQVHIKCMVLVYNPELTNTWLFKTRHHIHSIASYWDLFTVPETEVSVLLPMLTSSHTNTEWYFYSNRNSSLS